MTPDEFPPQDAMQDPTPANESDYTPQPLPDVLAGRGSQAAAPDNLVADPWAADPAEPEATPPTEADGTTMGESDNGAIAIDPMPESEDEPGWDAASELTATPMPSDAGSGLEPGADAGSASDSASGGDDNADGDANSDSDSDSDSDSGNRMERAMAAGDRADFAPPPPSEPPSEVAMTAAAAPEPPTRPEAATATGASSDVIDLEPIEEDLTEEAALEQRVSALRQEEERLQQRLQNLRAEIAQTQASVGQLVTEGLRELEQRRQSLQLSVEKLERRQERIQAEMRSTFAGSSQELAIRIQGFKDYLVGSLQDLVAAAEDLRLTPPPAEPSRRAPQERQESESPTTPEFAAQRYQDAARKIRKLLDQYRTSPDYYGPPWQLRRTFEPIHAERVADWFFEQGGRGAIRTMGSRLQNVLVASAAISVLHRMYGDRLRTLVLSDSPERLGEWRRGLQDCLGLGRMDFGSNQGVMLFEAPEALAQRADRLLQQQYLPLIIIDESEGVVDLSLLQFPLWLAFAIDPMKPPMVY